MDMVAGEPRVYKERQHGQGAVDQQHQRQWFEGGEQEIPGDPPSNIQYW